MIFNEARKMTITPDGKGIFLNRDESQVVIMDMKIKKRASLLM
jgi:hypothetical protein